MSTIKELDIECDNCGDKFIGTIWSAIHAVEDPELKDLMLGGELNMVMCPRCARITFQSQFVLYQDPPAELVAYVYPLDQQDNAATLHAMMLKGFKEAQEVYDVKKRLTYDPILFFGLESLVEMLNEEEARAEQSQIAQEICKEHKIPFVMLTPFHARRLRTMRVIPLSGSKAILSRDSALAGLKQLLKINSMLNLYDVLQQTILKEPAFNFQI